MLRIIGLAAGLALGAGRAGAQGPPPPPNWNAPVLTWTGGVNYTTAGVYPLIGTSGASFVFKVKYSQKQAIPAAWVYLYVKDPSGALITGSPFSMHSNGTTTWVAGVAYSATVKLTVRGRYSYRFQACDGGNYAYLPASGLVAGPAVDAVPVLSFLGTTGYTTGGVTPPTARTGTIFLFKIKYTDGQGVAPTSLVVHIWGPTGTEITGSPFSMAPVLKTSNYTTGAAYARQVKLTLVGTYSYSFTASDGIRTVTYPAIKLVGPIVTN
jgi:hypothetical protein